MGAEQPMEEVLGIRYFPPTIAQPTGNTSKNKSKKKKRQLRKARKRMAKSANLEKEKEEERDEEEKMEGRLDEELFKEMVKELDEGIRSRLDNFYADTLQHFEKLLAHPAEKAGLDDFKVPVLFLRGDCLNWEHLFGRLNSQHKELAIIRPDGAEINKSPKFTDLKSQKQVLLFFHLDVLNNSAVNIFTDIFAQIQRLGCPIYLVFHTSLSFSAINERLPRSVFIKMRFNSAILPSTSKFPENLFSDLHFPLGTLRNSAVQIHGRTLITAIEMFDREFRSLGNFRKALVLALRDYAIVNGNGKRPESKQRTEAAGTFAARYNLLLDIFIGLMERDDSRRNKFMLHCQIQADDPEFFAKLYRELKKKWELWPSETWRGKLRVVYEQIGGNFLIDDKCKVKCKELLERMDQMGENRERDEAESENEPPKQPNKLAGSSSLAIRRSLRRSTKSSGFLANQQRLRTKLTGPLPAKFRSDVFDLLDSLFTAKLRRFPSEFVAGPGPLHLLDSSLSAEIDHQLGDMPKTGDYDQLDIRIAYQLLVNHNIGYINVPLPSLKSTFCQLARPFDGLEPKARFLAAISQLERLGAIRSMSDEVLRLIYLPAAMLTKALFESKSA